ncbi:hypothetical protein D3C81_1014240 [compost metagenome]
MHWFRPTNSVGAAVGSSILNKMSFGEAPDAWPNSSRSLGSCLKARVVSLSIGGMPYTMVAMIAGTRPKLNSITAGIR